MSLNFLKNREWGLEETSDGPAIEIPSPCIWPLALFFLAWLAGWTAGEVSAAKALYGIVRGAEHWAALLPGAFLVFWLAGWTAGGIFAWGIFLFSLSGKEVVSSLNIGDRSIPDVRHGDALPHWPDRGQRQSIALCHIRTRQCADVHSVRRRAGAWLAALPGAGH